MQLFIQFELKQEKEVYICTVTVSEKKR
jgi:hypothetical protein